MMEVSHLYPFGDTHTERCNQPDDKNFKGTGVFARRKGDGSETAIRSRRNAFLTCRDVAAKQPLFEKPTEEAEGNRLIFIMEMEKRSKRRLRYLRSLWFTCQKVHRVQKKGLKVGKEGGLDQTEQLLRPIEVRIRMLMKDLSGFWWWKIVGRPSIHFRLVLLSPVICFTLGRALGLRGKGVTVNTQAVT